MQVFADLIDRLEMERDATARQRHLAAYFKATADPDRGWGLALLTGGLQAPRLKPAAIWPLAEERIDSQLLALSLDTVGDHVETIALSWPENSDDGPAPTLTELAEAFELANAERLTALLPGWLDGLDDRGRWGLLKLLTGGRKLDLRPDILKAALAEMAGCQVAEINEIWANLTPPYSDLFAWLDGRGERPDLYDPAHFRQLAVAVPLDMASVRQRDPAEFAAEWNWQGARVQLASGKTEASTPSRLYAADGSDLSARFPELVQSIPFDAVLDGQIMAVKDGQVLPESELRRRLIRKTATPAIVTDIPVQLRAYDLISLDGRDMRQLSYRERRGQLENLLAPLNGPAVTLAPMLPFSSWNELVAWMDLGEPATDGVVLKAMDEAYGSPTWYEIRPEPKLFLGVLMYVQPILRSQDLEVTIGVWHHIEGEIALVPVGKLVASGGAAPVIAEFLKRNTTAKFGPVREVAQRSDLGLVLEIAHEGVDRAPRRKSGIVLRNPTLVDLSPDAVPGQADHLGVLLDLLPPDPANKAGHVV